MVLFGPWNGPYRMTKRCILQSGKTFFKYKSLIFNTLYYPLIIRIFASEEESVRKYALIFRGRWGNSGRKMKICLQFESYLYCFIPSRENNAYSGLRSPIHTGTNQQWISTASGMTIQPWHHGTKKRDIAPRTTSRPISLKSYIIILILRPCYNSSYQNSFAG